MSTKYVTEDNLNDILAGIGGKFVQINNVVNRVKRDILPSATIVYNYGSFNELEVTFDDAPTNYDLVEMDFKYSVPGGSSYFETFQISKESLENCAVLSTSSPYQFCTTVNTTNAAAGTVSSSTSTLTFYFKATIVAYTDKPKVLKFMGSVGSSGSVSGTTITLLAARGINYSQSYGDTPLGTIISYMGLTPPEEYLACDGTSYNITDYWELADFIKNQFGSYNYFGGDGTTTFAVPDLRGEFLRGTGTNSHTNQGSGASVGVHQDGTEHNVFVTSSIAGNEIRIRGVDGSSYEQLDYTNRDSTITTTKQQSFKPESMASASVTADGFYTSRPTNTSVLYCIKYTNSPSMQPANVYSTTEKRIGTWIDGKPLYQKTYTGVSLPTTADNYEKILDMSALNIESIIGIEGIVTPSSNHVIGTDVALFTSGTNINANSGAIITYYQGVSKSLFCACPSIYVGRYLCVTIKYTKS